MFLINQVFRNGDSGGRFISSGMVISATKDALLQAPEAVGMIGLIVAVGAADVAEGLRVAVGCWVAVGAAAVAVCSAEMEANWVLSALTVLANEVLMASCPVSGVAVAGVCMVIQAPSNIPASTSVTTLKNIFDLIHHLFRRVIGFQYVILNG